MTYMQRSGSGYVGKGAPLMMNMHIMLAAVYDQTLCGSPLRPFGNIGVHPLYAEVPGGRRQLYDGNRAYVHHGPSQYLDNHGRAVLSVGNLQAARVDHRLYRDHFGRKHGRRNESKNIK